MPKPIFGKSSDFNKWGTPSSRTRHKDVDGWRIETELWTCQDGETWYRVKKARNNESFDGPYGFMGWQSKPPRKRKNFQTREAALNWALSEIERLKNE